MERVEHRSEDDVIELGVVSVETKGVISGVEFLGEPAAYELSDQ